ncbi:MAG TPA: hypothetical protein VGM51_17115 [Armatimonadota bacterium]|jgi:hypothetical protein
MVETEKSVKAAITERLNNMNVDELSRAQKFVESDSDLPRGMTGAEMMQLAGTLSHEEADEMMRIIDEEFETVDLSAW